MSKIVAAKAGSSPLTWRIPFEQYHGEHYIRIISTYVENTLADRKQAKMNQDHLHLRGEYSQIMLLVLTKSGSSPLTWRILDSAITNSQLLGIISTYVENTFFKDIGFSRWRDHLHLRGEYLLKIIGLTRDIGSSPLTWRIPLKSWILTSAIRIISTYVENTK